MDVKARIGKARVRFGLSSTEEYLEIQRHFTEKQDQDFQYICQGCSSLLGINMEDHGDHNKENTDFCQQLPKKNPLYLVV